MFTLRKGVIVSLGMFAGVGMNAAQAVRQRPLPVPGGFGSCDAGDCRCAG